MLHFGHPASIGVQLGLNLVVIVVIDVEPGLDTEASVPHPMVVVGAPRGFSIRGSHDSTRAINIQIR